MRGKLSWIIKPRFKLNDYDTLSWQRPGHASVLTLIDDKSYTWWIIKILLVIICRIQASKPCESTFFPELFRLSPPNWWCTSSIFLFPNSLKPNSKYGIILQIWKKSADFQVFRWNWWSLHDIRLFIKRKMENCQVLRNNNAQPKENKDSIVDQKSLPKGTENAPFCTSRFVLQKVV